MAVVAPKLVTENRVNTPYQYPTALLKQISPDFKASVQKDIIILINPGVEFYYETTPEKERCKRFSFYVTVSMLCVRLLQLSLTLTKIIFFRFQVLQSMLHGAGITTTMQRQVSGTSSLLSRKPLPSPSSGVEPMTIYDSFIYVNLNGKRDKTSISLRNLFPNGIDSENPPTGTSPNVRQNTLRELAFSAVTCGSNCGGEGAEAKFVTGAFFYAPESHTSPFVLYQLYTPVLGPVQDFQGNLVHAAPGDAMTVGDTAPGAEYLMSYKQIAGREFLRTSALFISGCVLWSF
jgi:hypothetical protein